MQRIAMTTNPPRLKIIENPSVAQKTFLCSCEGVRAKNVVSNTLAEEPGKRGIASFMSYTDEKSELASLFRTQ